MADLRPVRPGESLQALLQVEERYPGSVALTIENDPPYWSAMLLHGLVWCVIYRQKAYCSAADLEDPWPQFG